MSESSGNRHVTVPTLRTGQAHPHPEPIGGYHSPVELMPGYRVIVLDQRKLPVFERYEVLSRVEEVAEAIRAMLVRGAPAIALDGILRRVAAAVAPRPADGVHRRGIFVSQTG